MGLGIFLGDGGMVMCRIRKWPKSIIISIAMSRNQAYIVGSVSVYIDNIKIEYFFVFHFLYHNQCLGGDLLLNGRAREVTAREPPPYG